MIAGYTILSLDILFYVFGRARSFSYGGSDAITKGLEIAFIDMF